MPVPYRSHVGRRCSRTKTSAYSGVVQTHIVDGEKWIRTRLAFLREHLKRDDLTEDDRKLAHAEVQRLEKAPGFGCTGVQMGRLGRRPRRSR